MSLYIGTKYRATATIILAVVFISLRSFSQPVFFETWFGGSGADFARSVREMPNGDIYVFGYSDSAAWGGQDFALWKLNRYGNVQWVKYYGDSLDNSGLYMNTTSDGNFIVTGQTMSATSDVDGLVCKIDTAGNVLWTYRTNSPINESFKFALQVSDGDMPLWVSREMSGHPTMFTS